MSLKNKFQNGAIKIFQEFGDITEDATYKRKGDQVQDPITKDITTPVTDESIKLITSKFTSEEVDQYRLIDETETIVSTDTKGLTPAQVGWTDVPKQGDKIIRADLSEFQVKGFVTDPAEALYILVLRRA